MYNERNCLTSIEEWVRVNNSHEIIFEGNFKECVDFNKGHLMSKQYYEQLKSE